MFRIRNILLFRLHTCRSPMSFHHTTDDWWLIVQYFIAHFKFWFSYLFVHKMVFATNGELMQFLCDSKFLVRSSPSPPFITLTYFISKSRTNFSYFLEASNGIIIFPQLLSCQICNSCSSWFTFGYFSGNMLKFT